MTPDKAVSVFDVLTVQIQLMVAAEPAVGENIVYRKGSKPRESIT